MTVKLTGSSSGHVNLTAKAAAASNTLTLPDTASGELVALESNGDLNIDSNTLFVDASANKVGIGTTSPTVNTQIQSSGANSLLKLAGSTSGSGINDGLDVGINGSDGILWNRENGTIQFATNNTERLRIESGGKVGIGTASPSWSVHLKETGSSPLLMVERDSGATAFIESQASKIVIGSGNNNPVEFAQNSGTALQIDTSKNLKIVEGNLVIGTAGKGIDFSATSDASGGTSELLDDYEEGTWTPGLAFGGGTTGITYSYQTGFYTKIGRLVQCGGTVILSDMGSSTGAATLTGLPFTIGDNDSTTSAEGGGFITYWTSFGQNRPYHVLRGLHNTTTCDWMYGRDGGYTYSDGGAHSDFTDTASFRFILTFQT